MGNKSKEPINAPVDFPALFERHVQDLENLNHPNPKLMICFAAVPGSGKTTLAKMIEKRFLGVRISTDKVRNLLDEFSPGMDIVQKNKLVAQYHPYAVERLVDFPNGLLILDSSIDRKYREVFESADRLGYPTFIINFSLSQELLEERIRASKSNPEDYLAELRRWVREHADFEREAAFDIVVDEATDYVDVLDKIESRLRN